MGAAIPAAAQVQGTAEMVAAHDAAVDDLLKRQTIDPGSPWVGGIPDRYGLHNGGSAAGTVLNLMVCLLRPDSRHYSNALVRERLNLALTFLDRKLTPDGKLPGA